MTVEFSNPVDLFIDELNARGVNPNLDEVQFVIESLRSGYLGSKFSAAMAEHAYIDGKSIVFYTGLMEDGREALQLAEKLVASNRSSLFLAGETRMGLDLDDAIFNPTTGFKESALYKNLPLDIAPKVLASLKEAADTSCPNMRAPKPTCRARTRPTAFSAIPCRATNSTPRKRQGWLLLSN